MEKWKENIYNVNPMKKKKKIFIEEYCPMCNVEMDEIKYYPSSKRIKEKIVTYKCPKCGFYQEIEKIIFT